MAVSNLFRFAGMQFIGTQFGGTVSLGGVTTSAINPNPQVVQDYADGGIHPTRTTIQSFAEELSFTTTNIDKALDLIGSIGNCIEDGSSVVIYYALLSACAKGPAAGSVHRRVTISQTGSDAGLVHPGSFSCDHRGDASYSFMIKPKSDGVNSPLVIEDSVALPAALLTSVDNQNRYTIGPVTLESVAYDGVKQLSCELGIAITRESADSEIFDEFIAIEKTATKISLSGINPKWITAANIDGSVITHANTEIILRKRAGAAGFVAPVTAEHISLTLAGLVVPTNVASSNDQQPVQTGIDIYAEFDGTNVPLVVQTGVAY